MPHSPVQVSTLRSPSLAPEPSEHLHGFHRTHSNTSMTFCRPAVIPWSWRCPRALAALGMEPCPAGIRARMALGAANPGSQLRWGIPADILVFVQLWVLGERPQHCLALVNRVSGSAPCPEPVEQVARKKQRLRPQAGLEIHILLLCTSEKTRGGEENSRTERCKPMVGIHQG